MTNEWIKWNGGDLNFESGTLVDVKYRDGNEGIGLTFNGFGSEIIAYRLHNRAFNVGDKVTSCIWGKGDVVDVKPTRGPYSVYARFTGNDTLRSFSYDGHYSGDSFIDLYHGHGTFKVEFIPDPEPKFEYQWEYRICDSLGSGIGVTSFYKCEKDMMHDWALVERLDFKRREDTKREVK